jgi:hypothetical protein
VVRIDVVLAMRRLGATAAQGNRRRVDNTIPLRLQEQEQEVHYPYGGFG